MGMQCHFSFEEAQSSSVGISLKYQPESDTTDITLTDAHDKLVASINGGECWFDVGRGSYDQMAKLKFLIKNRICFQCS